MLICEHAVLEVVCNSDCKGRTTPCEFGRDICCCYCHKKDVCKDTCADAIAIAERGIDLRKESKKVEECMQSWYPQLN